MFYKVSVKTWQKKMCFQLHLLNLISSLNISLQSQSERERSTSGILELTTYPKANYATGSIIQKFKGETDIQNSLNVY